MIEKFEEINTIESDIERIILLRKRLNKSQFQFAKEIGVSQSYLGQVENYKYPFTDNLKKRINEYLVKENKLYADISSNFS